MSYIFQEVCCKLLWMGVAHSLFMNEEGWSNPADQGEMRWCQKEIITLLGEREKCCQTSYLLARRVAVRMIRMLHIDVIPLWWDKRCGRVFDSIAHRFRVTSTCQWSIKLSRHDRSDMVWLMGHVTVWSWLLCWSIFLKTQKKKLLVTCAMEMGT